MWQLCGPYQFRERHSLFWPLGPMFRRLISPFMGRGGFEVAEVHYRYRPPKEVGYLVAFDAHRFGPFFKLIDC